jgi:hypothetical protein
MTFSLAILPLQDISQVTDGVQVGLYADSLLTGLSGFVVLPVFVQFVVS